MPDLCDWGLSDSWCSCLWALTKNHVREPPWTKRYSSLSFLEGLLLFLTSWRGEELVAPGETLAVAVLSVQLDGGDRQVW